MAPLPLLPRPATQTPPTRLRRPQRITASLSNSNNNSENDQDNLRSIYVPPYGTIRPSIVILSAQRRRDYAVYDDEYSDVEEDSMGGNYWVNPSRSLDRFPSPAVEAVRRRRRSGGGRKPEEKRSFNGFRQGGEVTVSGGRAGAPRTETSGDWWETTRMDGDYDEDEYYDDDDDYEEDQYGEYGMPPPTEV
ncbi:hypothetical protein HJC23_010555 [Cyclotella cryptica]|uniref:Uncharacterized protein n=1 Tax=Cyclotella cryptica TaxID=29204 RepID=A0ABD3QBZ2_9STRA